MPERIQLRRSKGWRKPEGVVVVSRPGKWGNPYRVERDGRLYVVRDPNDLTKGPDMTKPKTRSLSLAAAVALSVAALTAAASPEPPDTTKPPIETTTTTEAPDVTTTTLPDPDPEDDTPPIHKEFVQVECVAAGLIGVSGFIAAPSTAVFSNGAILDTKGGPFDWTVAWSKSVTVHNLGTGESWFVETPGGCEPVPDGVGKHPTEWPTPKPDTAPSDEPDDSPVIPDGFHDGGADVIFADVESG